MTSKGLNCSVIEHVFHRGHHHAPPPSEANPLLIHPPQMPHLNYFDGNQKNTLTGAGLKRIGLIS